MKYSSNDRVKLRGVMPFIPEDLIHIIDSVSNNDTLLYTAPVNTYFNIVYVTLMYEIDTSGWIGIEVRDDLTNAIYRIAYAQYTTSKAEEKNIFPYYPFEVKPTYTLNIFASTTATLTISLSGFERSIVL